jgi:hypothetical protein
VRRLIVSLLLLAVAACGQAKAQPATSPLAATTTRPSATAPAVPSPSPSASPNPSLGASPSPAPSALPVPSTSASLLFAALEAKGTAGKVVQWDTVAIAGLDGYARAKTTFVPMPVPDVGCMAALLPVSAHVAAGKVYFADGIGIVRSLSADGQITQVTTFPLTSGQQMLSFAVSSDGSRLLGAIFTLPAKPQLACTGAPAVDGYSLDVYSAQAGAASTVLYHESPPATAVDASRVDLGIKVMALVGWDQVGPIATYPTYWATQGGLPQNFYGTPVRLDPNTGKVAKQVSDPQSCYVEDIVLSGHFLCGPGNGDISVRRPDGGEIWRAVNQPFNGTYLSWLSPDELRLVAVEGTGAVVTGQDGSRVVLVAECDPRGWLDSATVIGINYTLDHLCLVSLSAPGAMVDVGFKGRFVGTVRT